MLSRDPRMRPETAPIFDHDVDLGYTGRVLKTLAWFFGVILLVGIFVGWYFFRGNSTVQTVQNPDPVVVEGQVMLEPEPMPGNPYEEDTGRSGVYDFFYTMFGGIRDGLRDSPQNLNNVGYIDYNNIDNTPYNGSDAPLILKNTAKKIAEIQQNDGYRNSLYDVISEPVIDVNNQKVGHIHDIIVNIDTGEAKFLVIDSDDNVAENDLKALRFDTVQQQSSEGTAKLRVTEKSVENKRDFQYAQGDTLPEHMISLRNLRGGQILDDQGNIAGEIDSIIYENAEVQSIYFQLRPVLVPAGKPATFRLPFESVKIIRNVDGLDIRMNKEQTEKLAQYLYVPRS